MNTTSSSDNPAAAKRLVKQRRFWLFLTLVSIGNISATCGLYVLLYPANSIAATVFLFLLANTPLLLCLPGLLRRPVAAAWALCGVSVLYAGVGGFAVLSASTRGFALALLVFSIGLFVCSYRILQLAAPRRRSGDDTHDEAP